jgi:beta-N-acetylhexosaminidase
VPLSPSHDESGPSVSTGWGPTAGEWRRAARVADHMTLPQLAGGLIVASYRGTTAPVDLVRRLDLGGVIVSATNVSSVAAQGEANRRLQEATSRPWPVTIAVDQEGGRVSRIGPPMTQFPTYMSLGAAGRTTMARQVAQATGIELRDAGFTTVLAPVADVTIGPRDTAIGTRSAGSDPAGVAKLVAASTRGFAQAGVVSVVKHFPGHGSVVVDSHVGLPRQRHALAWLERRDFRPFADAVAAHVPAVMVGHIALSRLDRGVPADLSQPAIDLLRRGLGFHGVVVSDSLQMDAVTRRYGPGEAAVSALQAGVDVVLMPQGPATARRAIIQAVRRGSLTRDRLEQSVSRLGAVMLHQKRSPWARDRHDGSHERLSYRVSAAAVTLVAGPCRGPYLNNWVQPVGPKQLVRGFTAAALAAGLRIGHGRRLLLLDRDSRIRPAPIAVSVDVPYRLSGRVSSPTRLALFGDSAQAWQVLVAVLRGTRPAPGRLPVGAQDMRVGCS